MSRVAVIGSGYVGLVSGACFAQIGHEVRCIDRDESKIALLKQDISPIYEPGLSEMIAENARAGRMVFTTSLEEGLKGAEAVFIAVGTPPREADGLPDLRMLEAVVDALPGALEAGALVVIKSTVPIGTTRRMHARIAKEMPGIAFGSNPEFLREGSAIVDFMQPDRIVAGAEGPLAEAIFRSLYAPITAQGAPLVFTGFESAEMIKYTSNCMLAAKVAIINEVADLCEKLGADVEDVAMAVGLDSRIGSKFLRPGPGFGGSCFPKDALALTGIARRAGAPCHIIETVIESNQARKLRMAEKIAHGTGGSVAGKTLAILGLTFKPGTDDMRESPSLTLLPKLVEMGAVLNAYDPEGMKEAKAHFGETITFCDSADNAMRGADAAVILTEWEEFRTLTPGRMKALLASPVVVDLRNVFTPEAMREAGFTYLSVGRADIRAG